MTQRLVLRHGDCVDVLKGYENNSMGAIISDPPYNLTWHSGRTERAWDSTGIAFSQRLWVEVYRVLCPGGVIKAFSGTRTFHRMAVAMAEAGFVALTLEVWNYGSGFPKSLDVSKSIDRAAGAEREVIGYRQGRSSPVHEGGQSTGSPDPVTAPATDDARTWEGWGTALKPSWEPVCVGRKPE